MKSLGRSPAAILILALAASIAVPREARAAAPALTPDEEVTRILLAKVNTGWWIDFGMGWAEQSRVHDGATHSNDAMLMGVLLGRRLNSRWLMGMDLGVYGTQLNGDSTLYDDSVIHVMLAVRYVPQSDHGWIWGLGAGQATYYNKSLGQTMASNSNGNGWAANAALGYDWRFGQGKAHVEALLNVERGQISYDAPLTGQFTYSEIAVSVHMAFF